MPGDKLVNVTHGEGYFFFSQKGSARGSLSYIPETSSQFRDGSAEPLA